MSTSEFIITGANIEPALPELPISTIMFQKLKNLEQKNFEMIETRSGVVLKQEEVFKKITQFAINLQKFGIKRGDLVLILSENSYRCILASVSVLLLGAKFQCLNPDYTINELCHFFKISSPRLVCCSLKTLKHVEAVKGDFHYDIICFDKCNTDPSVLFYDDFLLNVSTYEIDNFAPVDVEMDEVAMLFSSSGTTGLSKVVELTHCGALITMQYALDPNLMDIHSNHNVLMYLPFFHGAGEIITYSSILAGAKIIIMDKFHPEQFLKSIEIYRISKILLVPSTAMFLAKTPLIDKYDISSLEDILCGSAPLKTQTERILEKRLNIPHIRQLYGLTEVSGLITVTQKNDYKEGSVGKVLPWSQVKICDLDTAQALGPNQIGELRAKTRAAMKGYCNNIQETKAAFDDEGWLKTGDLAYYDEDGFIYVVDRVKEMIKYKGFQVAPAELEGILSGHPAVKDVGVVGTPDDRAGELPVAFIVKQPGYNVTEDELIRYVAGNVSIHKQLHGGVRFVDEIPKTPSGKILRRILRELVGKN